MESLLHITELTHKDIKCGVSAVKFIKAMYDISDETLKTLVSTIVALNGEINALKEENKKLKEDIADIVKTMNANNEYFNDRVDKVIADFKVRISDEVEKDDYNRVEVDFDART